MALIFRLSALLSISILSACTATDLQTSTPLYLAPDYATTQIDLSTPEGTAYSMMLAMYRGDGTIVDQVFLENATLRRVKADGSVEPNGLKRWRDWVDTLDMGQAQEEIFGLEVEQFKNLATVWAPFVISFDDKIVGCGVNQLSMARVNEQWRVVFGMDTPAPNEACPTFKEAYLTGER